MQIDSAAACDQMRFERNEEICGRRASGKGWLQTQWSQFAPSDKKLCIGNN
jgi:hypothetical protein